jgi:predicted RNase H-like HicB family nuclease
MSEYYVIYEHHHRTDSWGAYVPDLPGCAVVGKTREEVARLIQGAIEMHVNGMQENGDPDPPPSFSTSSKS